MARLSLINNNQRRKALALKNKARRALLKAKIMNKDSEIEDRIYASIKLAEITRNSSTVRYRNRCLLSGRPRGFHRKFSLSRIALRDLGSNGMLPGLIKSSW